MAIYLSPPSIGSKEVRALLRIVEKGWFSMGPETKQFESEFAKYVGAKYAVAVNSCTSALFLSLKALGIGPGDEVIVPSFTFTSTAGVVVHCGATPVFVDVDKDNFNMDQKAFDQAVTKKTKAVMPVHYAGNRVSIKTHLPIIEDSAHLIPKGGDNKESYTRCYSFYTTKNMTTIDGGMITTNDPKVYEWLKKARLHGLSADAWKRYDIKSSWIYTVEFTGYKMHMTDLTSALGRAQLKRLGGFEVRRKKVISQYNELLGLNNKGTHLYPILVEQRDRFFEYMKKNEIGCSFHFTPLHNEPAYEGCKHGPLPVTEYIGARVVTLPLYPYLSLKNLEFICKKIKAFGKFKEGKFGLPVLE